MQHGYCGCQMYVNCYEEGIDNRKLVPHAARIVWVSNACKVLAGGIDDRILVE